MAIEKCPECEDQVLDSNYSCPGCGYVKRDASEPQRHPKQNQITTENTATSSLLQGVLSLVLFIVGILWFFFTADEYQQRGELNWIPLVMFVVGFIWYIIIRFKIWREHRSR